MVAERDLEKLCTKLQVVEQHNTQLLRDLSSTQDQETRITKMHSRIVTDLKSLKVAEAVTILLLLQRLQSDKNPSLWKSLVHVCLVRALLVVWSNFGAQMASQLPMRRLVGSRQSSLMPNYNPERDG